MRVFKGWRTIDPAALCGRPCITLTGSLKRRFDQLPGGHIETRMLRAESFGQCIHHIDIAAAFAVRLQHPRPYGERSVSPSHVDVIVFQEHCRREENICVSGRRGQEMFLNADK